MVTRVRFVDEVRGSSFFRPLISVYDISITNGDVSWTVTRRYSAFVELAGKLSRASIDTPPLPKKHFIFRRLTDTQINDRATGLKVFLQRAFLSAAICADPNFRSFVGAEEYEDAPPVSNVVRTNSRRADDADGTPLAVRAGSEGRGVEGDAGERGSLRVLDVFLVSEGQSEVVDQGRRLFVELKIEEAQDATGELLLRDGVVLAGTLRALLHRVLFIEEAESEFVRTFLTTHASLLDPADLLSLLFFAFISTDRRTNQKARQHILTVFKNFISEHARVIAANPPLSNRFSQALAVLRTSPSLPDRVEEANLSKAYATALTPPRPPGPAPPPIGSFGAGASLRDVDAVEIARQMTLIQAPPLRLLAR
jgi:hypothetical protein